MLPKSYLTSCAVTESYIHKLGFFVCFFFVFFLEYL